VAHGWLAISITSPISTYHGRLSERFTRAFIEQSHWSAPASSQTPLYGPSRNEFFSFDPSIQFGYRARSAAYTASTRGLSRWLTSRRYIPPYRTPEASSCITNNFRDGLPNKQRSHVPASLRPRIDCIRLAVGGESQENADESRCFKGQHRRAGGVFPGARAGESMRATCSALSIDRSSWILVFRAADLDHEEI
jgi:hypothetical protein